MSAVSLLAAKAKSSPVKTPVKTDDIQTGREVLRLEAHALEALADSLDNSFAKAVTTLSKVKGRVIITGMGKSGHVARKIAATFASTGTPATFVHPGEASHGDMGMIEPRDAVLALSNSGKAPELRDLISYTRRFEIPLIAITAGATSPLAEAADIVLLLPKQPEAGSLAMAPTTSTTMQIALGDALAVALFERRGFTAEDYKVFHPGGQLGKNLLKVKDLMHGGDSLPVVSPKSKMSDVLVEMSAKGFGCVGVVDKQGTLLGIITDGDLRRHMSPNLTKQTAEAVMTANPRTIRPSAMAAECLAEMTRHKPKVTNLFVVNDENMAVGVIHIHDLLRAGVV